MTVIGLWFLGLIFVCFLEKKVLRLSLFLEQNGNNYLEIPVSVIFNREVTNK
ncbi:hypothetical protein JCM21738_5414 [Mesobacillus boroniphilus JCM 21738]|uniref:Uncharacterized protein n=1 Tax=Mesobacillus boroniphilus JCM 21738 TaxID=1294265 RepID=W4RVZ8_9BACI|nr:hypothetical protein JCM21738_5414 [Mesobacillus boroniphilus JCM 21738]